MKQEKNNEKTNVMRILEEANKSYIPHFFDANITDGQSISKSLNIEPERTFKTLVTIGNDLKYYVFVIPVIYSLDLKKAAKSVNVKNVEMIKQKELFPLTGYVHGGCSAIGMKKKFTTVIDELAQIFDTICYSGGKLGTQVETSPQDLAELTNAKFADIVMSM